ncbi:hypothetical protein SLS58_003485 [Diplodia intermedia]|uniref:Rta1 domain protein n=1 Tax=Diplodia intermedia TaxID=856260 RepID=A0ABR3TWX2_9PEZI
MDSESLRTGCPAYIPGYETSYGYVPSEAAGIAFVVIFGISSLLHLGQTIWSKQWWTILFAIGGVRPTFWTAALYVILGRLIALAGPTNPSPLTPQTYLIIFCTADVVSLVLQAIGGGMASVAASAVPPQDTAPGTNIMVAGIVFQMAAITVFCALFGMFLKGTMTAAAAAAAAGGGGSKGRTAPSSSLWGSRTKVLVAGTSAAIAFIYVRSIYRTIELLQGWDGYLITHEVYFVVLDGAMMVCAALAFNVVHPGWFLQGGGGGREGSGDGEGEDVEMASRPFSTASTVGMLGAEEEEEEKDGAVTPTPGKALWRNMG